MTIKLVSAEWIRKHTFPAAAKEIKEVIDAQGRADFLIKSAMGSGKSYWADELAHEIATSGKNVLIAVPSGALAQEHKLRIEGMGTQCHILQSHKATFKGKEEDCPDYEDIQFQYGLGVESKIYKQMYCKNCPFQLECPYPSQYSKAIEPQNKVVIIQHAHFRCRETLMQLFQNKVFDIMIVDETFIDSLVDSVQPTPFEIAVFSELGTPWAKEFASWLEGGGTAKGFLKEDPLDLSEAYIKFSENNQPWRFKLFKDAYNDKMFMHAKSGLKIFVPLPNIPVRVLTDATPTLEEIKTVLNNGDIQVIGDSEIIDYRRYNKDNEVIQVSDSSLSKSKLLKNELFYDYLSLVAVKCLTELKDDKVLITVFKDNDKFNWTSEALEFFHGKFPSLDVGEDPERNKIVLDGMRVGVNTYKDFSVQFLICSVYMSDNQLLHQAYRTKLIANYWRAREDLPLIQNIYPGEHYKSISKVEIPVRRVTPHGVRILPDYTVQVPEFKYERMAYEKNVGKSQQAIRLRFTENPEVRKKVYILGNYSFPSLLITSSTTSDRLLKQLDESS